jgi:hypothetical protein
MEATQYVAITTLVTTLGSVMVYCLKVNHKRIRSKCCNNHCTSSVDVEDTTPPKPKESEPKPELRITIPQL